MPAMSPPADTSYPVATVRQEVDSVVVLLLAAGVRKKTIADKMGISSASEYSRKAKATTPERYFHFVQLGRLANWAPEVLDILLPPGWPFISRAEWRSMSVAVASKRDPAPNVSRDKKPHGATKPRLEWLKT